MRPELQPETTRTQRIPSPNENRSPSVAAAERELLARQEDETISVPRLDLGGTEARSMAERTEHC